MVVVLHTLRRTIEGRLGDLKRERTAIVRKLADTGTLDALEDALAEIHEEETALQRQLDQVRLEDELLAAQAFTPHRIDALVAACQKLLTNPDEHLMAEIFDVLADAGVEQVLTDSVRLLELHLVVLGDVDVAVRDVGCRWSGESRAVEMATSAVGPTAVVLVAACDRPDTRAELAEIPDSQLIEGDIGTVVLLGAG